MLMRIRLGLSVLLFMLLLPLVTFYYSSMPIHASTAILEAPFVSEAPQLDGTIDPLEYGGGKPLTLFLAAYRADDGYVPLPDIDPLPLTTWGAYETSHLYLGAYMPDPSKNLYPEGAADKFAIDFDQGPDGGSRDYRMTDGSEDSKRIDPWDFLMFDAYWKVDEQASGWDWDDEIDFEAEYSKLDFQAVMRHNTTGWHVELAISYGEQDLRNLNPGDVLGFACEFVELEERIIFSYPALENWRDLHAWPEIHLVPPATTPSTQATSIPGWEWLPTLGALGFVVFLFSRRKPQTR